MENQKLENLLNLALESTDEEKEKSENLGEGYNPQDRTWELIVKYSGDLEHLREQGIEVEEMINEYAILTVPESLIDFLSRLPQIEYIEKPKRLFFAINQAKAASCITPVQQGEPFLTGRGVLVAVVDSGIDYFLDDFRWEDGSTRILSLWDQSLGRIFSQEEINEALAAGGREGARTLVPSVDLSGHGTAVAGIAAGNGRGSNGRYRGIAYESSLLVVRLGSSRPDGFPRTTELMRAVNYAVTEGVRLGMPVAVNLSFGNTYGSHDGTSLLETFLNDISNYGKNVIVAGTGNEGAEAGHGGGILTAGQEERIELSVGEYQTSFSVQLWKSYADTFQIIITAPSGERLGPLKTIPASQSMIYRNTQILIYYGEPSPYSVAQEIYMDFIPIRNYVDSGIWTFVLIPEKIVVGEYDLWLPSSQVLNSSTGFLRPSPDITLTIPSTASQVISVSAVDDENMTYGDFSGRGYTRRTNQVKPDLAAPGVNIIAPLAGGGYASVTGTSFAAPMVTGSAALMMEWGIVRGMDPFLYGEKIKAYLIRGAAKIPGLEQYPNPQIGYGILCLKDSLPI